eukprot:Pgem_evm1s675
MSIFFVQEKVNGGSSSVLCSRSVMGVNSSSIVCPNNETNNNATKKYNSDGSKSCENSIPCMSTFIPPTFSEHRNVFRPAIPINETEKGLSPDISTIENITFPKNS